MIEIVLASLKIYRVNRKTQQIICIELHPIYIYKVKYHMRLLRSIFFVCFASGVLPLFSQDEVTLESPDGRIWLSDLKTAAKKHGQNTAHSSLQLTAYSLGASTIGFDP